MRPLVEGESAGSTDALLGGAASRARPDPNRSTAGNRLPGDARAGASSGPDAPDSLSRLLPRCRPRSRADPRRLERGTWPRPPALALLWERARGRVPRGWDLGRSSSGSGSSSSGSGSSRVGSGSFERRVERQEPRVCLRGAPRGAPGAPRGMIRATSGATGRSEGPRGSRCDRCGRSGQHEGALDGRFGDIIVGDALAGEGMGSAEARRGARVSEARGVSRRPAARATRRRWQEEPRVRVPMPRMVWLRRWPRRVGMGAGPEREGPVPARRRAGRSAPPCCGSTRVARARA